ncbi:hypothetical protein [Alkalicoccobacillus murimartini]|uniref:CamS family sex pheromone protein n=1 Tax=Alkalicoccobacillus murimartini TaxID=171685 RepID=A0ABT9YI99_9BACI|nr:hypothetical protein [Alkalicoccobacillus murimartini]MDQ0207588.1 hypothetical protein [Alkalicoccobacillus murimartini]
MKKFLVGFLAVSFLVACSSEDTGGNEAEGEEPAEEEQEPEEVTAESVLQNAEEAHNELTTVEVAVKESNRFGTNIEGTVAYNFTDNITYFQSERGDEQYYKDAEDVMLIRDYSPYTTNEEQFQERYIENKTNEHKNPFAFYKEFDEDFFDKFELSEREDIYVLTYIGDQEGQDLIAMGYGDPFISYDVRSGGNELEDVDTADVTVESLRLHFDIDKETYLVKGYELRSNFDVMVNNYNQSYEADNSYIYTGANEEFTAEKPDNDEMAIGNLTYDEQQQYEKEAFDYVDAVIQANIYQNVDEYVDRAPIGSEEEKREEGEKEQESFLMDFAMGMGIGLGADELGISEDKIIEISEAMMNGYAQSEYMIVDSSAIAEDTFNVTISVQGINQAEIERELDLLLTEKLVNGDITEESSGDDIADLVIDSLDTLFSESTNLNEARDVTVEVNRAGGGYIILDELQYLNGFVSPY